MVNCNKQRMTGCGIRKDRGDGVGGQIGMKVTYVYVVGVDVIRAGVCKQRVKLDSMSII